MFVFLIRGFRALGFGVYTAWKLVEGRLFSGLCTCVAYGLRTVIYSQEQSSG